ncbi:MAG: DUF4256 domain-containing protein [Anaerolineae bacterium]
MGTHNELSTQQREDLLNTLKTRFEKHMHRHAAITWDDVQARLDANPGKLWSLHEMEATGGEPDVVGTDKETGEILFYDCAAESPKGRRNTCYDAKAQQEREKRGVHPAGNVLDMAAAIGITLLTEAQYRELQTLDEFDTKTSSWIETPPEIRKRGGAIFADRRYDHVFVYHNGAPSFYAARGFRGALKI